jgi:hypothetical protein
MSALSENSVCYDAAPEPPAQYATVTAAFAPAEAWQLAVTADARVDVIKVEDDGWADVIDAMGVKGMVPRAYLAIDAPSRRPPPPGAPLRSCRRCPRCPATKRKASSRAWVRRRRGCRFRRSAATAHL